MRKFEVTYTEWDYRGETETKTLTIYEADTFDVIDGVLVFSNNEDGCVAATSSWNTVQEIK